MPKVLVAPSTLAEVDEGIRNIDDEIARGYYADGAYTAAPATAQNLVPDESTTGNELPQDIYRQSLLLRYRLLRANLRISPPADALAALDEDHPIVVSKQMQAGRFRWQELLRQTDPLPAQIAAMDQTTVLRVIGIIATGRFLKRRTNISSRLGRWIWALLGRVEEIGCLSNDEVAVLRDLGKRAASVSRGAYQIDDGDAGDEADGEYNDDAYQEVDEPPAEPQSEMVEEDVEADNDGNTALGASEDQMEQSSHNEQGTTADAGKEGATDGKEPEVVVSTDATGGEVNRTDSTDKMAIDAIKERMLATISSTGRKEEDGEIPSSVAVTGPKEAETHSEEGEVEEGLEGVEEEDEPLPSSHTLATLDMILTIVGEVYGQRDLLEARQIWQ